MWFSSWMRKQIATRAPRGRTAHRLAAARSRPRLEALEDRLAPAQVSLTVTSLADSGPGTLRAAILAADAGSHSDQFTIGFGVAGTIDLQRPLPDLNNSIAIQGPGASSLTVERAAGVSFASAIVTVHAGQTASLSGLTIANGNAGGILNNGTLGVTSSVVSGNSAVVGGGIRNEGTVTVSGCTLSGNSAFLPGTSVGAGGALLNDGTATVTSSTVSGNLALSGAGLYNAAFPAAGMTVSGCTLTDNSATNFGGGIYNVGTAMTVTGCTLYHNSAGLEGGGIEVGSGNTTIVSSTFSCNSAGLKGGAIDSIGGFSTTVRECLFAGNTATDGGAIYENGAVSMDISGASFSGNSASDSGGAIYAGTFTLTIRDCTLSGNSAGSAGGGIFIPALGMLTLKDSTVLHNVAPSGADVYNLGALTLDDSTVGVLGP
jgi:predicted outer membrane repeat protein